MRGSCDSTRFPCFAKTWNVYGIFEGDENNEEKWDLLGTNNTSESTYCTTTYNECCADNNIGTFTLKPMPSNKGYKHIRWRSEVASCSSGTSHWFATSGIDVYGTLSSSPFKQDKNVNTCFCRCSIHRNALTLNLL